MQGFQHRRARLIATAALLLASGEDVRAGEAVTTIHVTYDEAYEEVRPLVRQGANKQSITFKPNADGTIYVAVWRGYPAGVESGEAEAMIGKAGEGKRGAVLWSRPENNVYVRVWPTPTYVSTLKVTIQEQTCKAEVRYDLRPGHSEYLFSRFVDRSVKVYMKTVRAEQVKCWVGDLVS